MSHRDYLRQGQSGGSRAWVQKAAVTARSLTTVLADDPELQLPIGLIGNPVLVRGQLVHGCLSNLADIRVALNYTGTFGVDSSYIVNAPPPTATTPNSQQMTSFAQNAWNAGFVAAASFRAGAPIVGILPSILDFEGVLYAQTPGIITVRWCQNTSDVQPLQMLAGSWMSSERMDDVGVL